MNELKDQGLVSGSHKELSNFIPYVWEAEVTLLLHGRLGIGKTAFFRALAEKKAEELKLRFSEDLADINKPDVYMFISFIAHQMDMAETKGIPFPNKERTAVDYLTGGNLPFSGQGIILFDEINLAPPAVQNNLYQMVTKGYVGQYRIPEGYKCFAACNTEDDKANIYEMPLPLNNRMLHYVFTPPTVKDWVKDFAVPNQIDHRIIAYLQGFKPEYLFHHDPDADEVVKAFPTPRSWAYVSKLIAKVPDDNTKLLSELTSLAVGKGVGYEFGAFIAHAQDFNIPEIFKTGQINPPSRIDKLFALQSGIVSYYKEHKDGSKRDAFVKRVTEVALQFTPDNTSILLSQVKSVDPKWFPELKVKDKELFTKMVKYISSTLV